MCQFARIILRKIAAKIPILCVLTETEPTQRREAFDQFVFVVIVSMLPAIITAFLKFLSKVALPQLTIYEFIRPGELLASIIALIAPAYWVLIDVGRKRSAFKDFLSFTLVNLLLFALSIALFVADKSNMQLDESAGLKAGVVLYVCGLALWYIALLHQTRMYIPYETRQREEENTLRSEVEGFDPHRP